MHTHFPSSSWCPVSSQGCPAKCLPVSSEQIPAREALALVLSPSIVMKHCENHIISCAQNALEKCLIFDQSQPGRGREGGRFRDCRRVWLCFSCINQTLCLKYTINHKPTTTTGGFTSYPRWCPGQAAPWPSPQAGTRCAGRMTPKRRPWQSVGAHDAAGPGVQACQASATRQVESCCAQGPLHSSQGHGVLCPPRQLLGQEPPPWPPALRAEAQSFSWVYSWGDK